MLIFKKCIFCLVFLKKIHDNSICQDKFCQALKTFKKNDAFPL